MRKLYNAQLTYHYSGVFEASYEIDFPDSKVHGANMGRIWGQQDPGGPHVGPISIAIWVNKVFPSPIIEKKNIHWLKIL